MHVLGWVLATIMIVVFCAAVSFGLVYGTVWLVRLVRGWRYDWTRAKHLVWESVSTGLPATDPPGQDFYGSMDMAEEQRFLTAPGDLQREYEQIMRRSGWFTQTAADLSPEALDEWPTVSDLEGATGVNAPLVQLDSGPGVGSSLTPGLDTDSVCSPMAPRAAARTEREQVPGGQGQLRDAVALAPGGALGPRAAWVLACYEQRRREKWAWAA